MLRGMSYFTNMADFNKIRLGRHKLLLLMMHRGYMLQ